MKLYIAEKPSLGRAIADNLPGTQKKGDGYITMSNGDVVTWAAGHLWELQDPDYYAKGKNTFDIANLPLLPERFVMRPRQDPKTKSPAAAQKQIRILEDLIKRCASVVHVGDPDREGQAIVDNILIHAKNSKPVERLWLSAMDSVSVKKAIATAKPNTDPLYVGMFNAAIARSQDDWLVGMNLSPAISHAARKSGYRGFISVGRVQTPTLALVVNRDNEIENFKPKDYFIVNAEVNVAKGTFTAKYKVPANTPNLDDEGRISIKATADAIAARVAGQTGSITKYETKREKEAAPLPFSLSALQIYASSRWGYGAQQVLDTCQALYETHKLTSYPRTDCEYLPVSQHADAPTVMAHLQKNFQVAAGANVALKSRVFNDSKVTAHHAIIPTGQAANLSTLNKTERDLYEAICMRYIANFYPDYQFDKTSVEATFNGKDVFTTSGRVDIAAGWRTVLPAQGKKNDEEAASLPAMTLNEAAKALKCNVDSKKTTPPAYFTEGTLIEAMTNVHKFVTNPEIKKRLKEVAGIGTEATRANVLERLFTRELLIKDGKKIRSSGAAKAAIAGVPVELKDPGITALLEDHLQSIATGTLSVEKFIQMRSQHISKLVEWGRTNIIDIPKEFHEGGGGGKKSAGKSNGRGSAHRGSSTGKGAPSKGPGRAAPMGANMVALKVPFEEKDEAKALGARWNGEQKVWMVDANADMTKFQKWLPKSSPKM